jgi:hypothetical protein
MSSRVGSSVLSGFSANSLSLPGWLFYLSSPACGIADACCYVIAMLFTAKLLGRLLAKASPAAPYKNIANTTPKGLAFLLGILVFLLSTGISVLIMLPTTSLMTSTGRTSLLTSPYVIGAEIIPMYFALGYFLTPMALRLLAKTTSALVTPDKIALGRRQSFIAGCVITLLSVALLIAGRSFHATPAQATAYRFASAIISALPYTPLFIAYSWIAMKNEDEQMFAVALSGGEQQVRI